MIQSPLSAGHVSPVRKPKPVREANVQGHLVDKARKLGWFTRRLEWIGISGAPDLFMRHPSHAPGVVFLVETKKPKGKLRPSQVIEFPKLAEAGCTPHVIDTVAKADAFLEAHT